MGINLIGLVGSQWKTSLWNLVADGESDSSHRDRALFLLTIPQLAASEWSGSGSGGTGIAIGGGKWKDSSGGGGCLHWGSGPARSRVWRSGPAFMTACNSLPFSGNGLSETQSAISGGGGTGDETETILSSQSEEEKAFWESNPFVGSSSMVEIPERGGRWWWWKKSFWRRSLSHFSLASSLSLMAWFNKCLRWETWSSLFFSSSWTAILVCSSSRVVHKSEWRNSSIFC